MSFFDLNIKKLFLNVIWEVDYIQFIVIQEKVFLLLMFGIDVIGIVQIGMGKIVVYLFFVLNMWKFFKDIFLQIFIIVFMWELVVQVVDEVICLICYMNVVVQGVYGGLNINIQVQVVENGLDVLVGILGCVFDLVFCGLLKLKNICYFVIDEVDEMFSQGFCLQLMWIFDYFFEKW